MAAEWSGILGGVQRWRSSVAWDDWGQASLFAHGVKPVVVVVSPAFLGGQSKQGDHQSGDLRRLSGISELNTQFHFEDGNGYQAGYFFTLHVASLFIIGIMLAQYRETLVRQYRKIPAAAKALGL